MMNWHELLSPVVNLTMSHPDFSLNGINSVLHAMIDMQGKS